MASLKLPIKLILARCEYQELEYDKWRNKYDGTGKFNGWRNSERDHEYDRIQNIKTICIIGELCDVTEVYVDSADLYFLFKFRYEI